MSLRFVNNNNKKSNKLKNYIFIISLNIKTEFSYNDSASNILTLYNYQSIVVIYGFYYNIKFQTNESNNVLVIIGCRFNR